MPDNASSVDEDPVEPSPNVAAKLISASKVGVNGEAGVH